MSDLDSITSLLGSAATSAFNKGSSKRHGSLQTSSVDRALGAAASLGLSLAILRFVVYAYQAVKRLENKEHERDDNMSSGSVLSDAILGYMRRLLRKVLLDDGQDSNIQTFNDGAMMTHQGSCHCESVCFEAAAPRCLATQDGPGKIQFRRTEIKASRFKVISGKECLNTYYVYCKRTSQRGAHAFCSRCGVHVLFAPCKNSSTLFLNVNCLEKGIRKLRSTESLATISDGVAVEGQWDDQLSSISEVSAESTFMNRLYSQESALSNESTDWKAYPVLDTSDTLRTPGSPVRAYPVTPATPSTVDSFTVAESHASRSRITTADQDSLTAGSDSVISLNAPPKPSMLRTPLPPSQSQQVTTTPQVRDQMKYFMRRHLASPPAEKSTREEEKKSNQ